MRKALILLLSGALVSLSPAGLQAAAQQTGGVQGVAAGADKNPLANVTVQLRNAQTGELVGSTTANQVGEFAFASINPGNFVIEIVDTAGNILGTATVSVTAGAVATVGVTATALGAAAVAAGAAGGLTGLLTGTSLLVVSAVTAAGVTIAVVATQPPASPSR